MRAIRPFAQEGAGSRFQIVDKEVPVVSELSALALDTATQADNATIVMNRLRDDVLDVRIGAMLAKAPPGDGSTLDGENLVPFVMMPLSDLLARHPGRRADHTALIADILDALAGASLPAPARETSELHEDLTESEMRVLDYLPSNLSAPEIAADLCLSTSTIKTHMRHIYAKLDAHRRTEAVEQARARGLLGTGRTRASAAAHHTR